MTRDELLEHAGLDAFGLLDEYDADLYTRSFEAAPATVQDEIRRLQAELTIDPTLISTDENPPAGLRERVLSAVAAAVEREEAQLAPIATIGRPRHGEYDFQSHRSRLIASGQFWRAACFVLAAGAMLLAYAWLGTVRQNDNLIAFITREIDQKQVAQYLGDDFDAYVRHSNGQARVLRPVSDDFPGAVTLYVKENADGTNSAFVLAMSMPVNATYTVRVKGENTWEDVGGFVSNGVVNGLHLDDLSAVVLASAATIQWQIVDATGAVVLQT